MASASSSGRGSQAPKKSTRTKTGAAKQAA